MLLQVPPSKSVTHRAYLLASLCEQPTVVHQPLRSADCDAMLAALRGLGVSCRDDGGSVKLCGPLLAPDSPRRIDVENAGTALRLLIGQCARFRQPTTLTGDHSLQTRSSATLIDALKTIGAVSDSDRAPLTIQGPIRAGQVTLPMGGSSQFGSALLFALSMLGDVSELYLTQPIHSAPYFELSLEMARAFGGEISILESKEVRRIKIMGTGFRTPRNYRVEGDWSSAAFPLVAAMLLGQELSLSGLNRGSAQADCQILSILETFGASHRWDEGQVLTLLPDDRCSPRHISVRDCPDLFPILSILAATREGETRIDGAPNLRHKESDRIQLMADGLTQVGVSVRQLPDGLIVGQGEITPSLVQTEGDHRIRMSFRVLSLVCPNLVTDGIGAEAVSYPNFEADLSILRGLSVPQ